MAEDWVDLPLNKPLFANLDADAVVNFQTAIENGFINELGGHTRFPGMVERVDLGGKGRVYLHDINGDLIAANSQGQVHRIDRAYNATNVTSVPVGGGRRVIFAKTDRDLLMAAGGPIVRLRGAATEVLSRLAPIATHVAWIDNFTVAVEVDSGRFFHSVAGEPDVWEPLDTFSADGNPDNINSMIVTPFREMLLGGESSTEQFARQLTGAAAFYRQWAIGTGIKLPYAITFADNAVYAINEQTELARISGQTSNSASEQVARLLEAVDDWTDAWLGGYPDQSLNTVGQRFLVLQAPKATNAYGTKGVTLGYDLRARRFFSLYGWDEAKGVPARWPAWSYWRLWDKTFIGGEGKIYELTADTYRNGDQRQRWLVRTSHIASGNALQVKAFRLQVKRGIGTNTQASTIRVRCSRDGRPFGPWIRRTLGKAGERLQFIEFGGFGMGTTFMFEIACDDDCAVDLIKAQVKPEKIGH